jgi:hypothetical protein
MRYFILLAVAVHLFLTSVAQQKLKDVFITAVDKGWAGNSVNTVVFRKNSLVSFSMVQYITYYDTDSFVVVGRRVWESPNWYVRRTAYKGNISDAHNSISMMADGNGILHMAWDHHNHPLRYVKGLTAGIDNLSQKMPMTGYNENNVSYPEFFRMPSGDLLFLYRDGASGRGNLVMNYYDLKDQHWRQLHHNLVNGEGKRNAYWQAFVDHKGTIHLSWTWRESPAVESNHDICYARSKDKGVTWEKSDGTLYQLPITAANAEYAVHIPQNRELINQVSMCADENGQPIIASYWRDSVTNVPQYRIVQKEGNNWQTTDLNFRSTPFSLSGTGTKKILVSRPQVLFYQKGKKEAIIMIFRDEERGNRPSAVIMNNQNKKYHIIDLDTLSLGQWEPTFDTELWRNESRLHLFLQRVEQLDAEGIKHDVSSFVQVLEWNPQNHLRKTISKKKRR